MLEIGGYIAVTEVNSSNIVQNTGYVQLTNDMLLAPVPGATAITGGENKVTVSSYAAVSGCSLYLVPEILYPAGGGAISLSDSKIKEVTANGDITGLSAGKYSLYTVHDSAFTAPLHGAYVSRTEVTVTGVSAETLEVGGTMVPDVSVDADGTGWEWTADTYTLSLSSDYTGENICWSLSSPAAVNLVYSGDVTVENKSNGAGIISDGNLAISGSGGTLTIKGDGVSDGIAAYGNLMINGGKLNITGGSTGYGIYTYGGYVAINDGAVTVTSDGAGPAVKLGEDYCLEVYGGLVDLTVNGDIELSGSSWAGAYYGANLTVNGSVKGSDIGDVCFVEGADGGKILINGDVTANVTLYPSVGVIAYNNAEVIVTGSVSLSYTSDPYSSYGIEAKSGGKIIVGGDVVVNGTAGTNYGARAYRDSEMYDGGEITIDGILTVSGGGTYIDINSTVKNQADYTLPTTKAGYLTYTDGESTVWIRGTEPVGTLTITPTHAILTNDIEEVVFIASLDLPGGTDYSKVKWTIGTGLEIAAGTDTGETLTAKATSSLTAGQILITAQYKDGDIEYTATASVEILPEGIKEDTVNKDIDTTIRLLESTATINTAKTSVALVPVLIAKTSTVLYEEPELMSDIADNAEVKLLIQTKDKSWVTLPNFTAKLSSTDDRYLEITALPGAKTASNIKVTIDGVEAKEKLKLTVTTKYPKINVKVNGDLNKTLPNEGIYVTLSSPDGEVKIEDIITQTPGIDIIKTGYNTALIKLNGSPTLANKSYKQTLKVSVDGYDKSYASYGAANDTGISFNVKVVNSLPKLKLSSKSITLADGSWSADEAWINILSNDKKVPTDDIVTKIASVAFEGKVTNGIPYDGITIDSSDARYDGSLYIKPKAGAANGSGKLVVTFGGGTVVKLDLTVTIRPESALSISSKIKTATVNINHADGADIIDIPVTINADNVYLSIFSSWGIISTGTGNAKQDYISGHPLYGALHVGSYSTNHAELGVSPTNGTKLKEWFNQDNPSGKDRKIVLNIGSTELPGKTFPLTLTVTNKEQSAAVKLTNSGKINIAQPGTYVTATVTLKNTSVYIDTIDWPAGNDFYYDDINDNTFRIYLKEDRPVTMQAQTIKPEITLANGQKVTPTLKLTPVFTQSKKYQSTNSVTLYKNAPHTGADIGLDITTPNRAKLGAVTIDPSSYSKLGFKDEQGLQLIQSGTNTWTIAFEDYAVPEVTKGKLKNSYSLKIQLWAEGTYETDPSGKPVYVDGKIKPLYNGASKPSAKTKPTIVTVKVNVK